MGVEKSLVAALILNRMRETVRFIRGCHVIRLICGRICDRDLWVDLWGLLDACAGALDCGGCGGDVGDWDFVGG